MIAAFAGTPRFGALVLDSLIRSRHEIVVVFTQPDRPSGRGLGPRQSPVKELALAQGLRVEQPESISSPETIALLGELGAEVLTIAAFGQILKQPLLDAILCINVHGSLLPRYRGAAPVERAIMKGEHETGVSIMKVLLALDSGEVYRRQSVPIEDRDDAGAIYEKLARAGGEALVATLDEMEAGRLRGEPQDESLVTYAEKITPADRRIDWSRQAREIINQVRALSPHIGAYTAAGEMSLKIWRAGAVSPDLEGSQSRGPGDVVISGQRLFVLCGDGFLELLEVQPQGKRRMSGAEFLRGYRRLIESSGRFR